MKERPILFIGEMVRAILDGRKTQTRRVVKLPKEAGSYAELHHIDLLGNAVFTDGSVVRGYGQPGDRLWVRETWALKDSGFDDSPNAIYAADGYGNVKWCPSIHMPRWASRITLEITGVRVERLQEITNADAEAEGVGFAPQTFGRDRPWNGSASPRDGFMLLWSDIYGRESWNANPWVWVIEFKMIQP